jgi:hypothetical protein
LADPAHLQDVPEWWLHDRVPIEAVVDTILDHLESGRAFSAIRLGDGEGAAMDAPLEGESELATSQSVWWGGQQLGQADLDHIANALRIACEQADILGLPSSFQFGAHPRYRRVFNALTKWNWPRAEQMLVDANLHWYLQLSGTMAPILRHRRVVGVIGCRDLADAIQNIFHVGEVRTWMIRGETQFPGDVTEPHWPGGFDRVMKTLSVAYPGQLFLVGAGVLGKLYCQRIKTLGGVALDVGSVLDGWAAVESRVRFGLHQQMFRIEAAPQPAGIGYRQALTNACRVANIQGRY